MRNIMKLMAVALVINNTYSYAQPVIVDGAGLAAAGYSCGVMNGPATVAPGAGGAAITWNFSTVSMTPVGTYTIETPSSTPVAAAYPSGNYTLSNTPTAGSALYSCCIVNTSAMFELANSVTATAGSGVNYTAGPRKILKFPFNYLDTFTAPYTSTATSGYDFVEYDGYGTLITPWATYTNVVRVKCTYASSFGYAYNWYTLSPLLNVFSYSSMPNSYTGLSAAPTGYSSILSHTPYMAPNPFNTSTTVMIDNSIVLTDAYMLVSDVTGRIVRKIPVTSSETLIEREGLKAGLYFYSIVNSGMKIANEKFVIN